MPSAQDDAIERLDSVLAIPKDIITSQAVQSKKTEVLFHLCASDANTAAPNHKRVRKPDAKADDEIHKPVLKVSMLVSKLQDAFIEIKTFFEDDFCSNVLREVIASNSDPLLVIVRAGNDTRAQTAAYGYGAEVFYDEVNEILHREAPHQPTLTLNKYLEAHGNDVHIARRAYYMGRKMAKLDSTQVGLAQVAIQAKDHFERLLNDAIPLFWTAFQQHGQLRSLLASVDFGVVRKAFREALSKSRMNHIKFSSSVMKISNMDFGSIVRESIDLRSRGYQAGSDHLIEVTLGSLPSALSASQLYWKSRMLLSYAENAIVRGDVNRAWVILSNVTAHDASSDGEKLIRMKNTSIGQVEQYSMRFESAQHYFNICLAAAGQANDPGRYHVIHHTADIYCEQHKPEEAVRMTSNEYLDLKTQGEQRLKMCRRLGLSLLEAWIIQRELSQAKLLLQELRDMCAPGREPGVSDQLCHVRLVLAQARVCWYQHQWNETEQCLFEAQSLFARYDTFEKDGFYPLFVQLFLAAVHLYRDGHSEVECVYQHLDVAKRVKYFHPRSRYLLLERAPAGVTCQNR